MQQLKVYGKAGQATVKTIEINEESLSISLMVFLRDNQLPIASSCFGEGLCGKCQSSNGIKSCQVTVADYLLKFGNIVEFDYL